MSLLLRQHAALSLVTLERLLGVDAQGLPTYDSPVDVTAYVVQDVSVARLAKGEEVTVVATVWVDAEQTPLPAHNDRLTTAAGLVGIVVDRADVQTIQDGVLDHVVLRLREE